MEREERGGGGRGRGRGRGNIAGYVSVATPVIYAKYKF